MNTFNAVVYHGNTHKDNFASVNWSFSFKNQTKKEQRTDA